MKEPIKTLKKRRGEPDKSRLYLLITLFSIAGVVLIILIMSLVMNRGEPIDTGGATNETHQHDGSENAGTPDQPGTSFGGVDQTGGEQSGGDGGTVAPGSDDPTTNEPPTTSGQGGGDKYEPLTVGTKTVRDDDGNAEIVMIYPTLTASFGRHSTEELNGAIAEYMDERRRLTCIGVTDYEYEYVIEKAEVKFVGKSFFSALIIGHMYQDGAPHPTVFAYGVNFDANECRVLKGSELIFDFDRVKNNFLGGRFSMTEGMNGLLSETNYEDIFMSYRPEYNIYPEVYYTSDGFGIAAELVYSLGGYALFEIPSGALGGAVYSPEK